MQKKLYNKLKMYQAVLLILTDNKSLWEALLGFKTAVTAFQAYIKAIELKRPTSELKTGWVTEDKHSILDDLIKLLLDVAGQLHAIGHSTGNKELMAATDYEDSDFRGREGDIPQIVTEIVALARSNLALLAGFGITAVEIDALEALGATFETKKTAPRGVVSTRKAAGVSLVDLYATMDDFIENQLDKMMKKFARTNPEFFHAYENAKQIIDYGTRYEKDETTTAAATTTGATTAAAATTNTTTGTTATK
jgi:hypothetical protein